MRLTRRTLLAASAATAAARALPAAAAAPAPELRAVPATVRIAPEGYGLTPVWTYGGTVPGPEIRVAAGARVRRRLVNRLPQPTAVHWHGIRLVNAMDGAAGLTQAPVPPGEGFEYDFVAPDPGTYWYHAHARSWEQVARGLAGPLIVEDREPWAGLEGAAGREAVLTLADWRLTEDGGLHEESFGSLRDWAHAGRLGNTVTIDGALDATVPVRAGERLRLRLVNAATARIMPLRFGGHRPVLVALDGFPVAPRPVERVVLAPAQRADVVIDCLGAPGAASPILLGLARGEEARIGRLAYSDAAPLPAQSGPVRPLPEAAWTVPDLASAQEETLLMEGGAMGGMRAARLGGAERDARALAAEGRVWAFNGVAGEMDAPLFRARLGRTVRLRLRNDTAWAHGIHLHGHHFEVLSRNGRTDPHRDRRDTVLLPPGETSEIAFVADNPGVWMLHCHMLGHQAGGMRGWFEVG